MAKQEKAFVEHITAQSEDFSRWYTDVILKADMVDYSDVRGCMVIKQYGSGIWELMQEEMDNRFKATGHKNAYFPLLIPESMLNKEKEHVEGFAPEVAWVTHGGEEELQERLCIRPTSETIICSMYSKWIQSYRDLPMMLNQWCNVLRWEKTTRPFLRTMEFLWQEGHTAHATAEEAEAETIQMLHVYQDFMENVLAIPVFSGQKSDKEKFAGAVHTYSVEAMMLDGKSLQMGTSHFLGQNFAKGFDITYLSNEGKQEYVWQTSWGTSPRMIGGLIMVHGDDRGLKVPPKIAPIQCMIVPIAAHKEGVTEKARELYETLKSAGLRVDIDERDQSPGWKFNECELKGIPARIEIGPRDIENGQVVVVRRDNFEKVQVAIADIAEYMQNLMQTIQMDMLETARAFRDERTYAVSSYEELIDAVDNKKGFAYAPWCDTTECEMDLKGKTGITTRNIPFHSHEELEDGAVCVHCGKPAKNKVYFAKAY